jgi:hypothetical protein
MEKIDNIEEKKSTQSLIVRWWRLTRKMINIFDFKSFLILFHEFYELKQLMRWVDEKL